jgi:hypothetical protein
MNLDQLKKDAITCEQVECPWRLQTLETTDTHSTFKITWGKSTEVARMEIYFPPPQAKALANIFVSLDPTTLKHCIERMEQ